MENKLTNYPLAYLITFTTYGIWLHGNESGSIWKDKKDSGTILIESNQKLEKSESNRLKNGPFTINAKQRQCVLEAILQVSRFREWIAYAVHVRSNHVHSVVAAKVKPEKIMTDFKAYATRALRKNSGGILPERIWTRHGSTRYLWDKKQLSDSIGYVREQQGEMMAFGQRIIEG